MNRASVLAQRAIAGASQPADALSVRNRDDSCSKTDSPVRDNQVDRGEEVERKYEKHTKSGSIESPLHDRFVPNAARARGRKNAKSEGLGVCISGNLGARGTVTRSQLTHTM